jgi:two-component system, OmpR family, response regulator
MRTILVVEDEPQIAGLVRDYLEHAGFAVLTAGDGAGGMALARARRPDAIVLDLGLPKVDGLDVIRALRRDSAVPIVVLTARGDETDRVLGLELGADDYVVKPFSPKELVARVRAVLRRNGVDSAKDPVLTFADLELDEDAHEVRRAGSPIEMTPTEYRLLRYLLVNAGRVLTRSQILDHVWQYDFGGDGTVLETYISYLRRKIDRFEPPLIQTVRGVGYVLRPPRG